MKFLSRNLSLKLLSLLCAIFLWFYITNQIKTLTLKLPYEVKNIPQNRILTSRYKGSIKVKVSGPSFMLRSIESSFPVFTVNIPRTLPQDNYLASLNTDDLELPPAIQVLTIEPEQIELVFDEKITDVLPVEVPRIGVLDPDFTLLSVQVIPKRIPVVGPRTEVAKIKQVETYHLNMTELSDKLRSFKLVPRFLDIQMNVRQPGELTRTEVSKVKVRIKIKPVVVTKTFSQVPLEVSGADTGSAVLEPGNVEVRISGPRTLLNRMKKEALEGRVQVGAVNEKGEVAPEFTLPSGVTLLSVTPKLTKVTIKRSTPTPAVTPTSEAGKKEEVAN